MASSCNPSKPANRGFCIGSLDKRIEIDTRTFTAPIGTTVDYNEEFVAAYTVWANVITKPDLVEFDNSNTEKRVTHVFSIRFISDVTAQSFIRYDNKFFDILRTENLDYENKYLGMVCTQRGLDTQPSNFA